MSARPGPPPAGLGPTLAPRHGVVETYDSPAGLGVILEASGERHPFHCTQIADGSREIDPGSAVVFSLGPGHLGLFEAVGIEAVGIGAVAVGESAS